MVSSLISSVSGVIEGVGPDWADVSLGAITLRVNIPGSTLDSIGTVGDQVRLHTSLGDLRRRYDPRRKIEANLSRARAAGYRAAKDAVAAFDNLTLDIEAIVGCHNDFNPWNVVRGADRWYVFDWETAANNDPWFYLVCMFEGLAWSAQPRRETLERYAELSGRTSLSDERLRQFTLLFQLGSYAWAYAECCAGNDRAELLRQVETSLDAIAALS